MFKRMCGGHQVSAALVWVGALNWGLVGFFDWNLVNALVGGWPTVERVVYALVGVAALMMLAKKSCAMCGKACPECMKK